MASQQQSRIQSYLERNKIGPLFEVSEKLSGPSQELLQELHTCLTERTMNINDFNIAWNCQPNSCNQIVMEALLDVSALSVHATYYD